MTLEEYRRREKRRKYAIIESLILIAIGLVLLSGLVSISVWHAHEAEQGVAVGK